VIEFQSVTSIFLADLREGMGVMKFNIENINPSRNTSFVENNAVKATFSI
jgi:hypothetical protein